MYEETKKSQYFMYTRLHGYQTRWPGYSCIMESTIRDRQYHHPRNGELEKAQFEGDFVYLIGSHGCPY